MKSNLPFSYFGCALIIRNPRAVISDHALPALELESAGHARGARRGIQGAFFIGAVSQFNNRGRFPCEARLLFLKLSPFTFPLSASHSCFCLLHAFHRAQQLMDCYPKSSDKKTLKRWFFIDKRVG
ncbi:hypothetical protein HKD37_12G032851 [Glycine soja]